MKKINKYLAILLAAFAVCANAEIVKYSYQARLTDVSDPLAFSGLKVGSYFTGSISYDTSSAPSQNIGWWLSMYNLNGPSDFFTANLGGEVRVQDLSETYVLNGPAFPFAQADAFVIRSKYFYYTWAPIYSKGGATVELELSPYGNTGPLTSTSLPRSLSLTDFPFAGGVINVVRGQVPASGTYNYIYNGIQLERSPQLSGNVYGFGAFGYLYHYPQYMNSAGYQISESEYLKYLADGGPEISIQGVAFQLTSIAAAVPEPENYVLLLVGLGLIGAAAKRRERK